MEVWDWLESFPKPMTEAPQLIEVRFKNTRKGYYENKSGLDLHRGDIIAVEGTPGFDVGIVSMTSDLVKRQIKRTGFRAENGEYKKVLRMATSSDIERWSDSISKEHATMISSRQISADLGLEMKIGDVEYQGDGLKAIFYYIADGRVDFRELIKVLFERFRVRVEMKQIGARQEAGRIGGISPCGRELCCSSWINSFSTIGIGAARAQDISPNPQKLAGQCGKLKCCLNYEVDTYVDAKRQLPRVQGPLQALDGNYYLAKIDTLAGVMYFSPSEHHSSVMIPLSIARVREIQAINARGEKIDRLEDKTLIVSTPLTAEPELQNIELQESLTRFDNSSRRSSQGSGSGRNGGNNNRGGRNRGEGRGEGRGENRNENRGDRRDPNRTPNRTANGERDQNRANGADATKPQSGGNQPPREPREPREQREPRVNGTSAGGGENRRYRGNNSRRGPKDSKE